MRRPLTERVSIFGRNSTPTSRLGQDTILATLHFEIGADRKTTNPDDKNRTQLNDGLDDWVKKGPLNDPPIVLVWNIFGILCRKLFILSRLDVGS